MQPPKLRDGKKRKNTELYPIGDFPQKVIYEVRNVNTLEFTLFEEETRKYVANEYKWTINKQGNFEGHDKTTGKHKFTWQPHGSQFTIKYTVPSSATRFQIKRPPILDFEQTMDQIGFDDSWVNIKSK